MKNRNYNIYFHTHTVSGIVISVVLFVIFFAGSFSFFKEEISNWERNESVILHQETPFNTEIILDSISKKNSLNGRTISLYNINSRKITVSLDKSKDSLATKEEKESKYFILDTKTFKSSSYDDSYSLGEFLYRLHFLAQIPYPVGYYLSGLVALFFLFAILTGVLLHWQKIVSNFYVFRPKEKLKTMWTDAHTSLGLIGLPFQFIYAVTGAFFMIKLVLLAPIVSALYGGDQDKLYKDLEYSSASYEYKNMTLKPPFHINELVTKAKTKWENYELTSLKIENYGDVNMRLTAEGKLADNQRFSGNGKIIFNVATGKIVEAKNPNTQTSYLDTVKSALYRIHFGDYGGYPLKIISFIMGIIGCFVIISGVMIWLVARDKKNMPEHKRKFNRRVVRIYLAICLSMYPITALTFVVAKLFYPLGQSGLYTFYFIGWLVLTLFFILKRNDGFTTKYCLLFGSILGFLIPITNGIVTGKWFCTTFNSEFQLFFVDVFWIALASISLSVALKIFAKKLRE